MRNIDQEWDETIGVKTTGRDDSISDFVRFPYEPTDYCVLERLVASGYITKRNTVLDYGSGKGRVDFFLSFQTKCHSIGVEYNPRLYNRAMENKKSALSGRRTEFVLMDASDYSVPSNVDRIFFFNPFSVEILKKVIKNIQESNKKNPREILLIFYYPSPQYETTLSEIPGLKKKEEINCNDLFNNSEKREKLLIMTLE